MTQSTFRRLVAIHILATALFSATSAHGVDASKDLLRAAVDGAQRSAADKSRDKYRHPLDTLAFFGVKNDQTVVEIWPSAGWRLP